ncbi:MAG: hypothetical protein IJ574_01735 [Bacilli bacterium]|nr:hypothetical protein [Bacilli bacterium]
MKKILCLIVMVAVMLMPSFIVKADAKFGINCDAKQKQEDGTVTKKCYLKMSTTDKIDGVKASLALENVTLKQISAKGSWTNKSNGTSLEFTSGSAVTGDFVVAEMIFEIDQTATNCRIALIPGDVTFIEETYTCAIVDGKYWGKESKIVDEATYNEQCVPKKTYTCQIVDGVYWGKNNTEVDEATYKAECEPAQEITYSCAIVDGKYWGKNNVVVDVTTYNNECVSKPEPTPTPTPVKKVEQPKQVINNPETAASSGLYMVGAGALAFVGIRFLKNKQESL